MPSFPTPNIVPSSTRLVDATGAQAVGLVGDRLKVDASTTTAPATNANVASVAVGLVDVEAVAANAARKGLMVWNRSTRTIYLRLGSALTTTDDGSVRLTQNAYYELPEPIYTGSIHAMADAAGGALQVTETT